MTPKRFFLLSAALLLTVGCKPEVDPFLDLVDAQSDVIEINDVERAVSLAGSEQAYDLREFEEKTVSGLNRWVSNTKGTNSAEVIPDDWKRSPLVEPLLAEFAGMPVVSLFDDISFVTTDAYYLRQSDWMDVLTSRIDKQTNLAAMEFLRLAAGDVQTTDQPDKDFSAIVAKLNPQVSSENLPKLVSAIKMFDWVVRNIQLDPEVKIDPDEMESRVLVQRPTGKPWNDGVTGLGYHRSPYQLLVYGRGDFAERGKLFIKMLEHRDIPATMLAVDGRPWCVGVKIGTELFLFDPQLGLPLPGEQIGSVATLAGLRDHPEWLSRLDLTLEETTSDDFRYWVQPDQLTELTALLYVSPESLSHRMRYLEQRLVGDYRMRLSQNADRLAETFKGMEGVQPQLWDIEFKHHAFRQTVREALAEAKFEDSLRRKLDWYYESESYIDGFEAFRTARTMFINGLFESERNSQKFNAIENFYLLMYSDEQIDNLAVDRPLLLRLGILQGEGQNAAEFNAELRGVQANMRLVRRDAGLSMAQCHFDNGNVGTAANWLERISDSQETERWRSGIRYLLGRAFESRREYDRAINEYKGSDLAQKHGNLLRMRFLKEMAGVPASAPAASEEPDREQKEENSQPETATEGEAQSDNGTQVEKGNGDGEAGDGTAGQIRS